ncbi:MAG TPA: GntR family transcriptional regulator [Oleiagrimonas sp.]|nr:GntR family transcriptional regulator [Oleiagrimonas sp.]
MDTKTRRSKPRYIELGDLLRSRIESGQYPVDTQLPTELELCESFNVSRHTARSALSRLSTAGLVHRRPGAGTRVIARHEAIRYAHEIDSVDSLTQYGNTTRLQIIKSERKTASAEMAEELEIAAGKGYLHLTCLRTDERHSKPIAFTDILAPVRRGLPTARMLDSTKASRALANYLDPARLTGVEQRFDAAVFSKLQAKVMGITPNDAAMRVRRCFRDTENRILILVTSLHPAGAFSYSMTLSRQRR